jgi:hypothetical protein
MAATQSNLISNYVGLFDYLPFKYLELFNREVRPPSKSDIYTQI